MADVLGGNGQGHGERQPETAPGQCPGRGQAGGQQRQAAAGQGCQQQPQPAGPLAIPAAAGILAAPGSAVVWYEADELDPVPHTGWSVIATGMARLVREPAAITRYQQLLEAWAAGQMHYVISIRPQIITGIRLVGWCR